MDIRVKPVKGTALLFFPGFKNGMPDQRLLHTAEDAIEEKWVSQLWTVEGIKLKWPPEGTVAPAKFRATKPATPSRGKEQRLARKKGKDKRK